jgi:gamma-glutamylcyclotransferase (GGCT)/AIG2-like uncharacterized protein YtfP
MDELMHNSASLRVFVYGTLKPGEANYQRYCVAKVVEVQKAIAFGQLFSLPFGYPAMTPGNSPVQGFLLSFSDPEILNQLDWLEDYNPQRPATENEYYRQQIETYNTALTSLGRAWTYLMTPEKVHIYGGTFLPHGWWSNDNLSSPD